MSEYKHASIIEKIKTARQQFEYILEDFKKYYVFSHTNPDVDEYQSNYTTAKSQLQQTFRTVSDITTDLKQQTQELYDMTIKNDKRLALERKKYNNLNKNANINYDEEHGSYILYEDSTSNYNTQYYQNIKMTANIAIITGIIYMVIKNKK